MAGWTPQSLPQQLGKPIPPAPGGTVAPGSVLSGPGGTIPANNAPPPGVNPGGPMMSTMPAAIPRPGIERINSAPSAPALAGPGGASNPAFYGR